MLATQTLAQPKPKAMRINYTGSLGRGVTAKDLILGTIGQMGTGGAAGHAVEYAGEVIKGLSMEQRMTICNMTIEGGGRAGHDRAGRDHVRVGRRPPGRARRTSRRRSPHWRTLHTDDGATFDREITVEADAALAARHLGDEPRPGRRRHRRRPGAAGPRPTSARSSTWTSRPARRCRRSRSTACSSARARTPGSATCAPPPRWSRAARWPRTSRRWSSPAPSRCARRPRRRASTRSSAPPASTGARPAARCAWA